MSSANVKVKAKTHNSQIMYHILAAIYCTVSYGRKSLLVLLPDVQPDPSSPLPILPVPRPDHHDDRINLHDRRHRDGEIRGSALSA